MRVAHRVGVVDNSETISLGKLRRKAPRQLMLLGTCHVFRIRILLSHLCRKANPVESNALQANFTHQPRGLHRLSLILGRRREIEKLRQCFR